MKKFNICIDKDKKTPIYKQIYECIRIKIDRSEIVENTKLPSIRQLSIKFKINNLTILKAYNLLESEGYIYKKQGLGAFVKKKDPLLYFNPPKELMESFRNRESEYTGLIDFVSGTPSKDILPYEEFKEITKSILEKNGAEILVYPETQGYKKLRCFLSNHLREKNINISEKNIQITSGSQQGLDLMMKTLLSGRNNKIIVGNPTYHGALNAFRKECNIFGVSLEEDGFNLEELENILSKENIAFIYTMINFQSPTGISWSNKKRKKLIELAEKYNTYIIEDDCLSDIYFTEKPKVSLKSLDTENKRVVLIKSYSKVLMPGIRLGYIILPDHLVNKVISAKFTSDISSSGFEQRILLEFLEGGYFKKHLEKMKTLYRRRYIFLCDILAGIDLLKVIYPIEGGFYLWIELPQNINSNIFYMKCKEEGISILPGSVFSLGDDHKNNFRLSFAAADKKEIIEGLSRMVKIIKNMM